MPRCDLRRLVVLGLLALSTACATSESSSSFHWSARDPESNQSLSATGTTHATMSGDLPPYFAEAVLESDRSTPSPGEIPLTRPAITFRLTGSTTPQFPESGTLHLGGNGADTLNVFLTSIGRDYGTDSGTVTFHGSSATFTFWFSQSSATPCVLKATGTFHLPD